MGAPVFAGEEHEVAAAEGMCRPKAKVVLPCLALGMSPFIMQSTESLIAVCFNASLYRYGGDHCPVGAMTVLHQHHAVCHDAPCRD